MPEVANKVTDDPDKPSAADTPWVHPDVAAAMRGEQVEAGREIVED